MDLTWLGYVETHHNPQHIILFRVVFAGILGGLIGIEREARSTAAGLRTHMLVASAAALFTLLAFEIYDAALEGGSNNPDPIRAIEAVTAGIAFLGAGAIFQQRGSVQGLTTGAGMWLAGALGVTVALGYYVIAIAVVVFGLVVLAALRAFSHRLLGHDRTAPEPERAADGAGKGDG